MKKLVCLLTVLILLAGFNLSVSANDATPDLYVSVSFDGIPEGTVFVDVLMPKDAFADSFEQFNTDIAVNSSYRYISGVSMEPFTEITLLPDCELARYAVDGYFSFVCHFHSARAEYGSKEFDSYHDYYYGSAVDNDCYAAFSALSGKDTLELFGSATKIKLAYVDIDGNVLLVTKPFSVRDRTLIARRFDAVNVNGEKVKIHTRIMPLLSAVYFAVAVCAAVAVAVFSVKKKRKAELSGTPQKDGESTDSPPDNGERESDVAHGE